MSAVAETKTVEDEIEEQLEPLKQKAVAADEGVVQARNRWYAAQDKVTATLRAYELATGAETTAVHSRLVIVERELNEAGQTLYEAKQRASNYRDTYVAQRKKLTETRRLQGIVTRLYVHVQELRQGLSVTRSAFAAAQHGGEFDELKKRLEGLNDKLDLGHPNLWQIDQDVQTIERKLREMGPVR
jgi:predicted  nucleic acid-binding Zn-ribbon protein